MSDPSLGQVRSSGRGNASPSKPTIDMILVCYFNIYITQM